MHDQRSRFEAFPHVVSVLILVLVAITASGVVAGPLASSYPALDAAVQGFAEGKLDEAGQGFEAMARDASAPAFVRGLARFGQAETAIAGFARAWQDVLYRA